MTESLDVTFRVRPLSGFTILKYLRTLRHLKLLQVGHQLRRRLLPAASVGKVPDDLCRRQGIQYLPFARQVSPEVEPTDIKFLNKTRKIDIQAMDWRCMGTAKLWRYNLHYFDYLHWDSYSPETKDELITSWIRLNPIGAADAWEPYPVSLRTVNWIKFFLLAGQGGEVPGTWQRSLAQQLLWLEANLEYHLLANHLLKNAKALIFSGVYFSGDMARRHLGKGMHLMIEETAEQMLADGGHIERTPMYHCIVLEDLLDVVNLLNANAGLVMTEDLGVLRRTASRALQFLEGILAADGEISLFNDAAFGISPEPSELLAYGQRVLNRKSGDKPKAPSRICLSDTGYFGYRYNGDGLLIDCGPIGPDYQPGHGHCDTLSYELCINGRRVIVDSGVHDYEKSELRQYIRSTAAHNTVRIDGMEQSEIWGAFRVARRARPLVAELSDWHEGCLEFRGAHDGYCRLPGKPVHERRVRVESSGRWIFSDVVTGSGSHLIESFIHIHPDFNVCSDNDHSFLIKDGAVPVARLRPDSECEVSTVTGNYCPEFGKRCKNPVLILSSHGPLPLSLSYAVEKL
jgi:uncharacterized heparinase superfamily protein